MTSRSLLSFVALVLAPLPLHGRRWWPRRSESSTIVLRADRMLDVVGGRIVEDVVVVTSDGRIVDVRTGTDAVPQDVRVVRPRRRDADAGLHGHAHPPDR